MKKFITVVAAAAILAGGGIAYGATTGPDTVKVCMTKTTGTKTVGTVKDVRLAGDLRYSSGSCYSFETVKNLVVTKAPEVVTWSTTAANQFDSTGWAAGTVLLIKVGQFSNCEYVDVKIGAQVVGRFGFDYDDTKAGVKVTVAQNASHISTSGNCFDNWSVTGTATVNP